MEAMRRLESSSIDALITDPPAGISFMGKDWDHHKGGRDNWIAWMTGVMSEAIRVMKPGAHGFVWAIPRTSHWTATALENAGFEIRDVVTHLFGSGFPKSHDISKGIDKAAGAERQIVGMYVSPEGTSGRSDGSGSNFGIGGLNPITAPATEAAKQWQGWGTALKPASEHWILVRKPISEKTVAANAIKHGVGGINIDASRISIPEGDNSGWSGSRSWNVDSTFTEKGTCTSRSKPTMGRFPANLLFSHNDDCEASPHVFPDGATQSGCTEGCAVAGLGEPSRFFYCAKANKRERGEGNNHPTVKSLKLMEYLITMITPEGGTVLDPFMGSGSTGVAATRLGFNFVGIEKEKEYFEISQKRIEHEQPGF